MNEAQKIADALLGVLRLMVDKPQDISARVVARSDGEYTIEIVAPPIHLGKLIGKSGHTARSLRNIAFAMGMTAKIKLSLDLGRQPISTSDKSNRLF